LVSCIDHLPPGRCLDLAAGRGGNALFMAERGYSVDALDWSPLGLRLARAEALRRNVGLNFVVADLTTHPLPQGCYDVVLCFRYLERSLWPAMARALRPGGALLVETFTEEHRRGRNDFPPEFCLGPGELLRAFPGLRIAVYREMPGEEAASLLAFR
jgi:SAM-dependent methyltransferase